MPTPNNLRDKSKSKDLKQNKEKAAKDMFMNLLRSTSGSVSTQHLNMDKNTKEHD